MLQNLELGFYCLYQVWHKQINFLIIMLNLQVAVQLQVKYFFILNLNKQRNTSNL